MEMFSALKFAGLSLCVAGGALIVGGYTHKQVGQIFGGIGIAVAGLLLCIGG